MRHRKFQINRMTLALAIAFSTSAVQAVGTGEIVSGSGSINKNANNTSVSQYSEKMIINWNNMDIGKDESMRFLQPGRYASVLNRVNAIDPTVIQGALKANGQVFIVNPNGVLISNGATINVGSLVASSLNIKDADFEEDEYLFSGKGTGKVINAGDINAQNFVVLLGSDKVSNTGNINIQRLGGVALAAGETITLTFTNDDSIKVKIDQGSLAALVENGGMIVTADGDIALTAWATDKLTRSVVNNTGTLEAAKLFLGASSGDIYLGSKGNGSVDIAGRVVGLSVKVKNDAINIKDNALLRSKESSTRLINNHENGYVKFGKSRLMGNYDIASNNVFAGGADDQPTFTRSKAEINITSSAKSIEIGSESINAPSQIVSGKGVISKQLLDVLGKQTKLQVTATAGDFNLNAADLGRGDIRLKSDKGSVNINRNIKGGSLRISSRALNQAKDADITMANDFSVNMAGNITQNGNITAGEDLTLTSSAGNIIQATGKKTEGKRVSYSGKSLDLNGETKAKTLSLAVDKYTQRANTALKAEDELRLQGSDFTFTAGKTDVRSISINANSLNLSTDKNTAINRNSYLTGNLIIDSTADVGLSSLTVLGTTEINANNILGSSSPDSTDPNKFLAGNGATLNAKNDIHLSYILGYKGSPTGVIKLSAGKDISVQKQMKAADVNINAKGNVTFASNVSSNKNIAISAGNDIELNGLTYADGDTTLTGNNIRTSAKGSIASKKDTTLTAKNTIAVNKVSGGDNSYSCGNKKTKGNVVLKGENIATNGINAAGDVIVTANKDFTATRDVLGNNVNISADNVLLKNGGLGASSDIVITANNIVASEFNTNSSHNTTITAKETIAMNSIYTGVEGNYNRSSIRGDVVLRGNSISANGIQAIGDIAITGNESVTATGDVLGNNVNIFAGDVLLSSGRLKSANDVVISGNNIQTSERYSIRSRKSTTLTAKNTLAVGDISTGLDYGKAGRALRAISSCRVIMLPLTNLRHTARSAQRLAKTSLAC